MPDFLKILLAALGPAAVAGAVAGGIHGWHYLAAGFPFLLLDAVRQGAHVTVPGVAGFLLLFAICRHGVRRLPARAAVPVAAAVAAAPLVAVAGYQLNRTRGLRPSDLATPYALKLNLAFLAGCLILYLLACWGLGRWHRSGVRLGDRGGIKRRVGPGLTVGVAVLAILNGAHLIGFAWAEKDPARPDVLILLVDALRADHVSAYGYHRDTTPAIDSLAADGVLFRQAITQSTFTKSSIASLFTSRHAYQHGVYWGSHKETPETITSDLLPESETTLAEVLRDHGYLTAAWVQNSHLRHFMGFAQGFVAYHDQQGKIARIHRRFRRWLRGPGRRYPYFAYLHYIDLHDPYRPEPPWDTLYGSYGDVYAGVDFRRWGAYLKALREGEATLSAADLEQLIAYYDGLVRFIDEEIGRLLAELRSTGRYDGTLIILTADHGDGFMEHGFISHSTTPYEELVRVPLVVKFPGRRFAGQVVDGQVRLIDLMPTILAVAGIPVPPAAAGCSLLPRLAGEDPDPHCAYAVIEVAEEDAEPTLAIRTERWKYIRRDRADDELYDLIADPGERNNLAAAAVAEARPLRELAADLAAGRKTGEADRIELDPQLIRELQALGYLDDG